MPPAGLRCPVQGVFSPALRGLYVFAYIRIAWFDVRTYVGVGGRCLFAVDTGGMFDLRRSVFCMCVGCCGVVPVGLLKTLFQSSRCVRAAPRRAAPRVVCLDGAAAGSGRMYVCIMYFYIIRLLLYLLLSIN